jgi:hypothetical protein
MFFQDVYTMYRPLEKANSIDDCLEKQFTPHDLSDENLEGRIETVARDLLEAVNNSSSERKGPMTSKN